MSFQGHKIPIPEPPSEEIVKYWEDVRAGLAKVEPHNFDGDIQQAIRARRTKIRHLINEAGRLAREIEVLCGDVA